MKASKTSINQNKPTHSSSLLWGEGSVKGNASQGLVVLLTLIGLAGRLLPHPPNVTPLGGLSTWSGSRLPFASSVAVVFGTLFISDLFLGTHSTVAYVYGGFFVCLLLARLVKKPTVARIGGITLLNAVVFFLITNFGVWQSTTMYPHTVAGLIQSYAAAVPFLQYSLLGDIGYTALLFSLEYVTFRYTQKTAIVNHIG